MLWRKSDLEFLEHEGNKLRWRFAPFSFPKRHLGRHKISFRHWFYWEKQSTWWNSDTQIVSCLVPGWYDETTSWVKYNWKDNGIIIGVKLKGCNISSCIEITILLKRKCLLFGRWEKLWFQWLTLSIRSGGGGSGAATVEKSPRKSSRIRTWLGITSACRGVGVDDL